MNLFDFYDLVLIGTTLWLDLGKIDCICLTLKFYLTYPVQNFTLYFIGIISDSPSREILSESPSHLNVDLNLMQRLHC